jgi:hypothetical protein
MSICDLGACYLRVGGRVLYVVGRGCVRDCGSSRVVGIRSGDATELFQPKPSTSKVYI